ncbi:hypothetical protein TPHA_0B01585 [Tetrapisispora phaffii CBS 4417]|uniref:Zn(2)-C6 fungal-type domain-containing protein n=1 Tax=Tetrapisispora phaffii (strain ATCC 24235 / CBS 4417 / NBRC 1672 / NRRL Y-8282 / UCD 70-5) TaxID=1071381 RepID=G8BPA0_TETPH|nr:hypothetical protein TPHA_0B01585 [Tetrapisispora phaffii CBS 4417]CCE61831.1 hypothetical protein TPHA_0B01585 [Tetrapisispora phaffii CBS 4417]
MSLHSTKADDLEYSKASIVGVPENDPRLNSAVHIDSRLSSKSKRSAFACVRCHRLKQKCLPSDLADIYRKPCSKCKRMRLKCVFDLTKRKRNRKRNSNITDYKQDGLSIDINIDDSVRLKKYDTFSSISGKKIITDIQPNNTANSLPAPHSLPIHILQSDAGVLHSNLFPNTYSINNGVTQFSHQKMHANTGSDFNTLKNDKRFKNSNDTNSDLKVRYNYHISSTFENDLYSLLIAQKDKLQTSNKKLEEMSHYGIELLKNTDFPLNIRDIFLFDILTEEEATFRLAYYRNNFSVKFPICSIKISKDITVRQFWKEKPILLSAIMSCVSIKLDSSQTTLEKNVRLDGLTVHLISNSIFLKGEKSIEQIESMLTICTWYNFPEWFSKTKFHIFNYMCCSLVKDLGPTSVSQIFGILSDEDPEYHKLKVTSPLLGVPNGYNLILMNYISSINISIFLRQTIQTPWSPLIEQVCKYLETTSSNDLLYPDKGNRQLVIFVRINHALEEIHLFLYENIYTEEVFESIPHPNKPLLSLINELEEQLDRLRLEISPDNTKVLSFLYSVDVYLHEYTISKYIQNRSQYGNNVIQGNTLPNEVKIAFLKCQKYCQLCLKTFLKFDSDSISNIPLYLINRIVYTVGVLLLKLRYFTIVLAEFHSLEEITKGTTSLINQVTLKIKDASILNPFNNYLIKMQYVIALFAQTFATKVKDLISVSVMDRPLLNKQKSNLQFNDTFLSSDPHVANNKISVTNTESYERGSSKNPSNEVNSDAYELTPWVDDSLQLNDIFSDLNSIESGYTAMNDEFWNYFFDSTNVI